MFFYILYLPFRQTFPLSSKLWYNDCLEEYQEYLSPQRKTVVFSQVPEDIKFLCTDMQEK